MEKRSGWYEPWRMKAWVMREEVEDRGNLVSSWRFWLIRIKCSNKGEVRVLRAEKPDLQVNAYYIPPGTSDQQSAQNDIYCRNSGIKEVPERKGWPKATKSPRSTELVQLRPLFALMKGLCSTVSLGIANIKVISRLNKDHFSKTKF